MKILNQYSHLNGLEFLIVHKTELWQEIQDIIASLDAEKHKTEKSKGKAKAGRVGYSSIGLTAAFIEHFRSRGWWNESRLDYGVTDDERLIRDTLHLPPDEAREHIDEAGKILHRSHNQSDFIKDRVAVEIQLSKYFAVNLFAKHLAFYVSDSIDVGVEVVPTRLLHKMMSTGVPWYEKALYDVVRQGRGVPPVPLVLLGVSP